jgi:hypothetical protein
LKIINFVDIRNEAVSQIKEAVANEKIHIEPHPGRFSEIEIKQAAQRTPAVFTSILQIRKETSTIDFVSWVLYRSNNKDMLYDGALKLVNILIPVIGNLGADWSIDVPSDITAECLFSGQLDAMNVTLWAVRWSWKVLPSVFGDGGGGIPIDELDIFEGYDAEHEIGGNAVSDSVTINNQEEKNGDTI